METLLTFDHTAFLAINQLPHTPVTNGVALFLSGAGLGGLIWVVISVILFLREEKKDHRFFVPIVSVIGASWVFVELLLKNMVARPRPFVDVGVTLVGTVPPGYSFPSSHATIAFAMAFVLGKFKPRWSIAMLILAVLISLSRVYLGVHYPLDVLAGAWLGWGISMLVLHSFHPKLKKRRTA